MACAITLNGIAGSCEHSRGGITAIWIAPAGTFSPTLDASGETITSGTSTGFKKYSVKKGTCTMTSTLNVDAANGVNYVSTELTMVFTKMDTAKRVEFAALAVGDLDVVVKDGNGMYWFLGYDEAVAATGGEGATGTAASDGNHYSITLTDESTTWPYPLATALAEDFEEID